MMSFNGHFLGCFVLLAIYCGSVLTMPSNRTKRMAGQLTLDGNSFFFQNYEYEHARIAQWGTWGRGVGTYEQRINADQLWILQASTRYPGFYYISNAVHRGYRLAKWGSGDGQTGVYNGQFNDDQLWRFQLAKSTYRGDFYRIFNKKYSRAKIAKWGKGDGDWGSFSGGNYNDQLWKLIPRYKATADEVLLESIDNRDGSNPIPITLKYTTGMRMTHSQSLTTTIGFESSIQASVNFLDFGSAGFSTTISSEIQRSMSSSSEKFQTEEKTIPLTVPAEKWLKFYQTQLHFNSDLESDNTLFYSHYRVEEIP